PQAAIYQSLRLGGQAEVDRMARRAERQRFGHAFEGEIVALAVAENDGRGGGAGYFDAGNGEPEDRAQVKLELIGELRNERDHAGVVGTRREFREDGVIAGDEELDPENA